MATGRLLQLGVVALVALAVSACGTQLPSQTQEKIAVVNWEQATTAHPQYARLQQGERVLADLLNKRKVQEELAHTQLSSLDKLRNLRQLSQQSFLAADFETKMAGLRARENSKLQEQAAKAEAEVEAELAPQTKSIEADYQLRIFNLRTQLETLKLKPDERDAVEAELKQVQQERGQRVAELQAQKQQLVTAKMQPLLEAAQARLQQAAQELHSNQREQLETPEKRDQELLSAAPTALREALAIMDREINKQQEKNDQLTKQINADIESQALKLAHERGYSIVFNQFKANLKAEDITQTIIKELQQADTKAKGSTAKSENK